MNEPMLIVDLRFTCYISTNDCISFDTKKERIAVKEIIINYFTKLNKENIQLEQADIKKNHIKISFKASVSVNLPKFISNLKSVTSRAIKKNSYLGFYKLHQKTQDAYMNNCLMVSND